MFLVNDLTEHPNMPIFVVSLMSGKCTFFFIEEKSIKVLKNIFLQREALSKVKFSHRGSFLGVTSAVCNSFFLLSTNFDKDIYVSTHLCLKNSVVDFLIYEIKNTILLLFLLKSSSKNFGNNYIEIQKMNLEKSINKINTIFIPICYKSLKYTENSLEFFALPYLRKELNLYKIQVFVFN